MQGKCLGHLLCEIPGDLGGWRSVRDGGGSEGYMR